MNTGFKASPGIAAILPACQLIWNTTKNLWLFAIIEAKR